MDRGGSLRAGPGGVRLWYGPGSAHDSIWYGTTTKGHFQTGSIEVKGTYTPVP
ncbi:hypothetical protein ACRAR1_03425 [Streptomyces sanyensis]|uniref:hypothetical protein n=1 Tax=Streptomyces sanyensis TaxID=568869 RepID=UPI003D784240